MALQLFKISDVLVESPVTSITFSSIPQGYTDLIIKTSIRSTYASASPGFYLSFNGSTSTFTGKYIQGNSSAVISGSENRYGGQAAGGEATVNTFSNDEIYSILPLESGGFLTVGVSSKLGGVINQNGTHDGVILLRIDENGDTLYTRKLNIYGYPTPYLIEKYPGIYQTVIDARIPMGTGTLNCPAIVEFNEQGVIFQTHILSQYPDWLVSNAIKTKDYGVILSGTFAGGLTAQTQMMSIKVNFLGEVEWSQKWNPPASVRGDGRRLFQTDSNEFMVTGTLGRRIGRFTFDSLGNQLATKVFYETPSMRQFDGGEASPTVTKGDLATGYYRNGQNQVVGSFSKRNNLGLKEWGGEQKEAIFDYICTNTDETFWVFYSNRVNDNVYLKKFGPDSSSLKEIYLFQAGLNGCEYRQYLPLGNNQVIAVGYRTTSNFGNQFLITKIDSFGNQTTLSSLDL